MNTLSHQILVVSLVALGVACGPASGSEVSGAGGSPGSPHPVGGAGGGGSGGAGWGGAAGATGEADAAGLARQFCDGTFSARLSRMESCCPADLGNWRISTAHEDFATWSGGCVGQLQASASKQRITFDADALPSCLAAVANPAPSCSWIELTSDLPEACRSVVVGLGEADSPCVHSHECKPGLTCNGQTGTSEGVCSPPGARGTKCVGPEKKMGDPSVVELPLGDHPPCIAGDHCDGDLCNTLGHEGGPCSLGGSPGPCGPGMACVETGGTHRVCVASDRSAGAACDLYFFCADGLGCIDNICAPALPAGSSCTGLSGECEGDCGSIMLHGATMTGTCASLCGSG